MPQNASPAYSSAAIEVPTPTETVVIALDALPSPHPIFCKKSHETANRFIDHRPSQRRHRPAHIAEITLGLALLFSATRQPAAIALIVLFCLMLPANIYAAMNHINYETGENNGKRPAYLWFRIPLQLFFIAWIGYFSL